MLWKNPQNYFLSRTPFVKMEFEIYKYFTIFGHRIKYSISEIAIASTKLASLLNSQKSTGLGLDVQQKNLKAFIDAPVEKDLLLTTSNQLSTFTKWQIKACFNPRCGAVFFSGSITQRGAGAGSLSLLGHSWFPSLRSTSLHISYFSISGNPFVFWSSGQASGLEVQVTPPPQLPSWNNLLQALPHLLCHAYHLLHRSVKEMLCTISLFIIIYSRFLSLFVIAICKHKSARFNPPFLCPFVGLGSMRPSAAGPWRWLRPSGA